MSKTSETTLEKTALDWFETLGWQFAFGPDIGPEGSACERRKRSERCKASWRRFGS